MKYIYLSKEILKDKRLTPATKLVAHHLFHISGWEKENIIPSAREIAKILGIGKDSALSALKKLSDLDYLFINADNTFTFKINSFDINKKDLTNKMICNIVGDFVIVPTVSLYCDLMTPAERDVYFKFFDFYFKIDFGGKFDIKKSEIHISSVSKYYGDNERGFRKHIQNIKEKGLIEYSVVPTGFGKSKLVGVKAYTFEKKWIINNGKTLKTKEEIETKDLIKEDCLIETDKNNDLVIEEEEIETLVNKLPDFVKKEYEQLYLNEKDNKVKYDWLIWKLKKLRII